MATYFDEDLWYGSSAESEAAAEQKAAKSIAAKVGRILGAKPFPIAAQRLSELTRDPHCPMHVVVDVLESDPALSARLLRLVNSAGYTLRTPCSSVGHAAALVGIRKLNQIASTAAILDLYDSNSGVAAATLEHAAIVGALCRYLAAHVGLPQDELFTCGFLHDIGKLMLLESEGEEYSQLLRDTLDEPDSVHIKERALLGYDHALLAGHVLSAWSIPAPIPKVVAWHHQVALAYQEGTDLGRMVSVVRLADAMSVALFRQFPDFEVERLARTEAASYLEISEPQIAAMWDEMFVLAQRARAGFRGEPAREPEEAPLPSLHPGALEPANDTKEHTPTAETEPFKRPQYFPCVTCGVPSYANTCSACKGYVCPAHQDAADEWCSLCLDQYAALEVRMPPWLYALLGSAIGAMLVGTLVGAAGAVTGRPLKVMVAPGLMALLVGVLLWSWQRFFRRLWFLRTVPNRKSLAPPRQDPDRFEFHEEGSFSRRWINPFELSGRGPIVHEMQEDLEPMHGEAPSSVPPPTSVRRVSLRPSRRDADKDVSPYLSVIPAASSVKIIDPGPFVPTMRVEQKPEPSSKTNSRKPAAGSERVKQDFVPTVAPKKRAVESRRAASPMESLVPLRPSFRPLGNVSIAELEAFDAPEPLPVSARPESLLPRAEPEKKRRRTSKKPADTDTSPDAAALSRASATTRRPARSSAKNAPPAAAARASLEPTPGAVKARRTRGAKPKPPAAATAPTSETAQPPAKQRRSRPRRDAED